MQHLPMLVGLLFLVIMPRAVLSCDDTCRVDKVIFACDVVCDTLLGCDIPPTHEACDQCAAKNTLGQDGKCVICGSSFRDTIDGTAGDDVICGRGGADVVNGMGGNDIINGGSGADTLIGGAGDDRIFGKGGSDTIFGEGGSDLLSGGRGEDTITTHFSVVPTDEVVGSDVCGGSGDDTLFAFNFDQQCVDGGRGTDECTFTPPPNREGNDVATPKDCEVLNVPDFADPDFVTTRVNTCNCP